VLDTFSLGECGFAHHGYLFALLVATIGERPLGLQVGQVLAAARWLANREQQGAVTVEAIGPRSSVIATVAAALDPEAIAALELHHSLDSLHRVIDDGREYAASPELFCFGLLEAFDIPQLRRLIEPRPIRELVP
jgi:hypothetical protein